MRFNTAVILAMLAVALVGCSSTARFVPPNADVARAQSMTAFPASISPALVAAAPMAQVLAPPASAMNVRTTQSEIQAIGWQKFSGAAVSVAIGADSTLFALSTAGLPSGDKFIYHYTCSPFQSLINGCGKWVGLPGAATHLTVAPNGTLWAVNSGGGLYSLAIPYTGSWQQVAGGASDISAAVDSSIYAISSVGNGPDRGIWHLTNGSWTQLPGAGQHIAAGTIKSPAQITPPSGLVTSALFVTNSSGGIYSMSDGISWVQLPGAAVQVAPLQGAGGLVALGNPGSAQHGIYYNDLFSNTWTAEPGAAIQIATNILGDNSVYAVGTDNGIYMSQIVPPAFFEIYKPPSLGNYFPLQVGTGQVVSFGMQGVSAPVTVMSSTCNGIATLNSTGGNVYSLVGLAAGTCTTVFISGEQYATLIATVFQTPPQPPPFTVSPTSVNLTTGSNLATAVPLNFSVTDRVGVASSTCGSDAIVYNVVIAGTEALTASSIYGGSTPGSCSVTFADERTGQTAVVAVNVTQSTVTGGGTGGGGTGGGGTGGGVSTQGQCVTTTFHAGNIDDYYITNICSAPLDVLVCGTSIFLGCSLTDNLLPGQTQDSDLWGGNLPAPNAITYACPLNYEPAANGILISSYTSSTYSCKYYGS